MNGPDGRAREDGRSPTAGREQSVRTEPRPDPDRRRRDPRHQQQQQQQDGHVEWWTRWRAQTASSRPAAAAAACRQPETVVLPDGRALTLALAADGYRLGGTVGHGSYSKVHVAMKTDAGTGHVSRLACKKIDCRRRGAGASAYVSKFLPRELDVLRKVRHPHVVRTHRMYVTPATVLVFMDYCEMGDLLQHMGRTETVPQWQARAFFRQLCDAVDYLHRNGISHRDIKCENVLLETQKHVKLTDFGFTRMFTDERDRPVLSQTYCGSALYAAPEVLQGIPYDPKASDVWALGVVLYVMLAECMPFTLSNRQKIVACQISKKLNTPKKFVTREAQELLETILEPDVKKRVTMNQLRRHQWVSQPN